MKTLSLTEIKKILSTLDPIPAIEQGFLEYSKGKCIVPPVGELIMDKGEVHIKYGCVKGEEYYVIKIASGFYKNYEIGLPTSNGLMLLFNQNTGALMCTLHDECYLTDIRTAIAGAITAKYLAPKNVTAIGIVGTGVQARLQADYLKSVTDCRDIIVWGRRPEKLVEYRNDMREKGFNVTATMEMDELCGAANLIVTTTPSETAMINADQVRAGTHITAMGSDTPGKQELDSKILEIADVVVGDSISQCLIRGEICQAIKSGNIDENKPIELGNIIAGEAGRVNDQQITVADLTGVAVQDIKIAEAVYLASLENN